MTDTNDTNNPTPPAPAQAQETTLPPLPEWILPADMVRAHTRKKRDGSIIMINPYPKVKKGESKRDPISHRPRKVGRPKGIHTKHQRVDEGAARIKPDIRHHVDPMYAEEIKLKLDIALAYFVGVQSVYPNDMINRCVTTLEEVRTFINHFTFGGK